MDKQEKVAEDDIHGQINDYESDPMYQAIYRASARALIRYQQKIYLAEYMAELEAKGLLVAGEQTKQNQINSIK